MVQPVSNDKFQCLPLIDRLKEVFGKGITSQIQVLINKVELHIDAKSKKKQKEFYDRIAKLQLKLQQKGVTASPIFWANCIGDNDEAF